ncbi:MAG: 2OG-Fe(II) oxygenase family protein [Halioglobus sp.]|nr:2OG-Fe(II) oxygenase family protein [Halioglobus sp.]
MIPTIDLQSLDHAALDAACRDSGLFALQGHGMEPGLIEAGLCATQQFFQQPKEAKARLRRSATNCWGYNDAELTKNKRDWKEILDIGPPVFTGPLKGATPQWPDLPGFKETLSHLADAMHRTALTIVDELAACLNSNIDLDEAFREHSSFLRLNFYPPCPNPATDTSGLVASAGELGISHHSDAGAVTVLLMDGMPGLQFYSERGWTDVECERGTVIINIGDVVQVWSNDAYLAPLHRVVASSQTSRISMPYFLNPAYSYTYAPLTGQPRYRPINWGEFRAQRSAGDYADVGSEIQISDFAVD